MSHHDELNSNERDWSAPTHAEVRTHSCRGCGVRDGETQFNGWPYCRDCAREMRELAMSPQARELERAARQDIDRDDFVDEMNRSRR